MLFEVSLLLPLVYVILFILLNRGGLEPSPTVNPGMLKFEYKLLQKSVNQREQTILLTGSIFVTASLLLAGEGLRTSDETVRTASTLLSWTVYAIWLFMFQLTSGRLIDRTYARMRWIENNVPIVFQVHEYLARKRDPVRRWIWLALLQVLLLVGSAVLGGWGSFVSLAFLQVALLFGAVSFTWLNERCQSGSLVIGLRKGRILQITFLVVSGWFGEWSFVVSLLRAFADWLQAGYPRSYPRIVSMPSLDVFSPPFSFWYGITWRVEFVVGDLAFVGVALALLAALVWVFYEFLKNKTR
jgi:hypothetical protein